MGRKRKSALSEEKRNVIAQLLDIYEIKTAADVQEALKDLLGGTLQSMLEAELDQQIEEREEADPEYNDSRNGYKRKTLRSSLGEIPIQVRRTGTVTLIRRSCRSTRRTSERSRAKSLGCSLAA